MINSYKSILVKISLAILVLNLGASLYEKQQDTRRLINAYAYIR